MDYENAEYPFVADFETLFHQAPVGYLIAGIDGTILEVNDTFLLWTGLERAAVQGTKMPMLFPPGDRSTYTNKALPQLEGSGAFTELPLRIVGSNGRHQPLMFSATRSTPGPGAPSLDRIIVCSTADRRGHGSALEDAQHQAEKAENARIQAESDSAAHRKALAEKEDELETALEQNCRNEFLLNAILNTADIGIGVVDRDGNAIMKNCRYQQDLQYATPTEDRNAAFSQLLVYGPDRTTRVPPHDIPLLRAARGETFSQELIWIGYPGNQRALSISAQSVSKTGVFSGSVIAYGDVTRLINAVSAKADFLANVSHELRTPLTSIIGYLELVLDEPELPGDIIAPLNVALRNCERLMQLVSDLLSTVAGCSAIVLQPADLATIIHERINSAAGPAGRSNVNFTTDFPSTLPMALDPLQITQLLDHLLSNAIKFSPNGGRVTIGARQASGHITVKVTDTGIGMTTEELAQAFTTFFRGGTALKTAIPGAGLGLAITKSIVEAHHGTINLISEPGEGTTVVLTLPCPE